MMIIFSMNHFFAPQTMTETFTPSQLPVSQNSNTNNFSIANLLSSNPTFPTSMEFQIITELMNINQENNEAENGSMANDQVYQALFSLYPFFVNCSPVQPNSSSPSVSSDQTMTSVAEPNETPNTSLPENSYQPKRPQSLFEEFMDIVVRIEKVMEIFHKKDEVFVLKPYVVSEVKSLGRAINRIKYRKIKCEDPKVHDILKLCQKAMNLARSIMRNVYKEKQKDLFANHF